MTKVNAFIKKHSVPTYFALTFALTWGCMAMILGPGSFPITAEQFETAGPFVYLAMLVGPSVAGILLVGLINGKVGLRELLARLLRWRVSARWYAVAFLTAPLLATAILLTLSLLSSEFLPALATSNNKPALLLSGIGAGLIVGFFEELGWTGFAVPQMRLRYGVLSTGVIVGLLWGAWHFIVFWESDSFSGAFPLALLLARLVAWLPPYRILMVWVYGRTQSLFIVILMHASLVVSLNSIVPLALTGTALLTWLIVWAAALWVIVAVVARSNSSQFSRHPLPKQVV